MEFESKNGRVTRDGIYEWLLTFGPQPPASISEGWGEGVAANILYVPSITVIFSFGARICRPPVGSYFNYRDYDIPNAPTPREQLEDYFGENIDRILDIRCDRDPKGALSCIARRVR